MLLIETFLGQLHFNFNWLHNSRQVSIAKNNIFYEYSTLFVTPLFLKYPGKLKYFRSSYTGQNEYKHVLYSEIYLVNTRRL